MELIESLFKLKDHKTSFRKEVLAGLATFLTMAYIMVVNPAILSETGMDFDSVFVATILASFVACMLMGILANWPVALAPGMGLNAFFTYAVVFGMGFSWQQALAAVFCSGILFLLISLSPLRAYLINAIPKSLKFGIGAGIGLFLAIIGLKNAGIVVDNPATLVGLGDLKSAPVLLALLTFTLMIFYMIGGHAKVSISSKTRTGLWKNQLPKMPVFPLYLQYQYLHALLRSYLHHCHHHQLMPPSYQYT